MQTEIPASSRQAYPPAKGGYHRARRDLLSGGYHREKVDITAPGAICSRVGITAKRWVSPRQGVGITAKTRWVSPRQGVGISAKNRPFGAFAKLLNQLAFPIVHRAGARARPKALELLRL